MEITPAAKNLIAGTSSNPLDDLVSIFGNTPAAAAPSPAQAASPAVMSPQSSLQGGLGDLGGFGSPVQKQPQQSQSQQEDLLGLF